MREMRESQRQDPEKLRECTREVHGLSWVIITGVMGETGIINRIISEELGEVKVAWASSQFGVWYVHVCRDQFLLARGPGKCELRFGVGGL